MEKTLKDYLHLYLGCDIQYPSTGAGLTTATLTGFSKLDGIETTYKRKRDGCKGDLIGFLDGKERGHSCYVENCKLILRPLSDMTKEEADYFAISCMKEGNFYLDDNSKIEDDEIQTELHKDDGGNMLDADVEICIEVSCRCFVGFLLIKKDGSISIEDEDGKLTHSIGGMANKIHYLLKQHFDLFGLREAGLCLYKSDLK